MQRVLPLLLAACLALPAWASDRIEQARQVYADYVRRYHAFDPAVADLYADEALVRNTRTYPTGQVRELVLPAPQYRQLVRSAMPLAQARGDRSEYREPVFTEEARGVRVNLTRFSALKNHSSPLSLLIGPDASGTWRVLEELSASVP